MGRTQRPSRWAAVARTPVGAAAVALVLAVLAMAVLAPLLWGDRAAAVDTGAILAGPSAAHWAGTDHLGRDLFARVLVATRLSVSLALLATAIAVVLGLLLGAAPVLLGRRAARFTAAAVNTAVAFPGLLLALFFAVVFDIGATGAVLAIGLAGVPAYGRLCQTLVAGVADRDYIAAARLAGVGRVRLLLRHVLPNIGEPLAVNATVGAGGALLAFAGLSFLGLGVQEPAYDWGRLLQDGVTSLYLNPMAALVPGLAIVLAGLAFNLVGESVAAALGVGLPARDLRLQPARPATAEVDRPRPDDGEAAGAEDARAEGGGAAADEPVLEVRDLRVTVPGGIQPVRGISFDVARGEAVGIVGESGSGKSLTALAVAQLLEAPVQVSAARLRFAGTDLRAGADRTHAHLLGTSMAMVFQDPMASLNPTQRIGSQLAEVARHHLGMGRAEARARAVDRLRAVRIPAPERRARQHPHELSGGMRQRAMIGMGLMGEPRLLIADEPTTALDVTVQQQVLDLLTAVRRDQGVATVLISHDVSVVREVCDRVLVVYAGRIVEDLPAAALDGGARHPYTRALVAAVPDMATDLDRPLATVPGRPVDAASLPVGCAFAPRCALADARCREEDPALVADPDGWRTACWHPLPADGALPATAPAEAP